jgi:hypothetical protein
VVTLSNRQAIATINKGTDNNAEVRKLQANPGSRQKLFNSK